MPAELQINLLRVLQEKEITRLGGSVSKPVDVRVIAAANKDLSIAIKNATFRADLYYRLNVLNIKTPPLRARKQDIELLSYYFLKLYKNQLRKDITAISEETLSVFQQYDWPGNVRELENIIERGVNLAVTDTIELSNLPPELLEAIIRSTLKPNRQTAKAGDVAVPPNHSQSDIEFGSSPPDTKPGYVEPGALDPKAISPEIGEYNTLIQLLQEERGHVKSIAERMDLPVSTVYSKLRKYNLNAKSFKVW